MISRTSWGARALLLAFLAGAANGCNDDVLGNAVQVGEAAPDFALDPANTRGTPGGTTEIVDYTVESYATSLPDDAFRRAGDAGIHIGYGSPACSPGLGGTRCYNFGSDRKRMGNGPRALDTTWVRDSIGDPRLPAMKQQNINLIFAQSAGPEYFGANIFAWEHYIRMDLAPSTTYSMLFIRYGLEVRGELDAAEMLRVGTITEPDSLIVLDPNPGGYPVTNYTWVSNAGCNNINVPAGANPLHLGVRTTASTGRVTFDQCHGPSNGLYHRNKSTTVVDSNPFYPNSMRPSVTQEYNYIEIREGPTGTGRAVARIQVGADIDPATRQTIPNSFGPFPTRPLTPGTLIIYGVATGGVSAARIGALNLEELEGSAGYRITGLNRVTGALTPLTALYWTVRTDTTGRNDVGEVITEVTVSETTTVTQIKGGGTNIRHVVEPSDALNPGVKLSSFTDIGLQPPSATTGVPIWARLVTLATGSTTQPSAFHDVDTTRFGTFPLQANAVPYIFRPAGSGSGVNRGTEIGIEFRHLSRPAVGYYYVAWLATADGSKAPVQLGELTTPLPQEQSLRDADIASQIGGVLTANEITTANVLVRPAELKAMNINIRDYDTIRLTLESKDGIAAQAPLIILEGIFPNP